MPPAPLHEAAGPLLIESGYGVDIAGGDSATSQELTDNLVIVESDNALRIDVVLRSS